MEQAKQTNVLIIITCLKYLNITKKRGNYWLRIFKKIINKVFMLLKLEIHTYTLGTYCQTFHFLKICINSPILN